MEKSQQTVQTPILQGTDKTQANQFLTQTAYAQPVLALQAVRLYFLLMTAE
jgi:hypothetical protein